MVRLVESIELGPEVIPFESMARRHIRKTLVLIRNFLLGKEPVRDWKQPRHLGTPWQALVRLSIPDGQAKGSVGLC